MFKISANLVRFVYHTSCVPKGLSKKRVLQIFFSISLVLFCFAVTRNMDSDSTPEQTFPCGKCSSPVTDDQNGLQCDTCNMWFHAPCQRVGNSLYDYLSNSNCSWHCTTCDAINYSLGSVSDFSSFTSVNIF